MNVKLEGMRTFLVTLVAILTLIVGMKLVSSEKRADVFVFFATALVGLAGAQVVKSVGSAAVNGEGITQGFKNLMGPSKPGDPPTVP